MTATQPVKEVEGSRPVLTGCITLEEAQEKVAKAVSGRTEKAAAVAGIAAEAVGSALKVPPSTADLGALRALCRYGRIAFPAADPAKVTRARLTFALRLAVCIDATSTRTDRVDRAAIAFGTRKYTVGKWLAAEETANSATCARVAGVFGVEVADLVSPGRPRRRLDAPSVARLARMAHKGEVTLCRECSMVPGAFRALMAGTCPVPARTLDRLSSALGAPPTEFCHGIELRTVDVDRSLECLSDQAKCLTDRQANSLMRILDRWFEANQVSMVSLVG